MALWLNRAGSAGEYEKRFLDDQRIYLTWDDLRVDLSSIADRESLRDVLREYYANAPEGRIIQNSGQIWAFVKRMEIGDWVVLPSKMKPAIHFGEITGGYTFDMNAADPFFHYRSVKWLETDVPRSRFDQDLLYSFGAFSTVCQIKRNNAEQRIREMAKNGWKSAGPVVPKSSPDDEESADEAGTDLELLARDSIAKMIEARFKGHGMAVLVEAVLKAQGYTTFRSPEGPDKGIDILAGGGPLGFDSPRIAVQVKSGDSPIDRPTLDQLIGAMANVNAQQGLLVSWGGFKITVDKEKAAQFFRVRLWDQDTLIEEILSVYDKLDDDLRTELPLKRIWTVSLPEETAVEA